MKVVNFGSLNIDHVYTLDHIVTPGETLACASLDIVAGGKGMNQSVALAKCGVDTVHAGCVGTDGGWLRDMLVGVGVDCSYLRDTNCPNGHAVIQVEKNGQNSIFIFGGSNQQLTEELIDETLSDLSGDCMVVMQNETSNIVHVAEKCRELLIPLAFNPSPVSKDLLASFPFETVDYLLINETEGKAISGKENPEDIITALLRKYPKMKLILTLGSEGALYADSAQRVSQSAFRVKATDTTAAGDTFTGFFLGSIIEGYDVQSSLRRACAASALAVTRPGAVPSIPSRDEVESFLEANLE